MEENREEIIESAISTPLNVLCAICSEFFKNTDIINSTTKCGHVFHRRCLHRWLARSNTCPQCRSRVLKHNVHRLYLNFSEPTDIDETEPEPVKGFDWLFVDGSQPEKEVADFGFVLGLDKEGNPVYAARAYLEYDVLPGCYVPKLKGVYTSWNCKGHLLTDNIEILDISNDDAEYKWVPGNNGDIPENSFETGHSEVGETLYIARALYNGRYRFGKLHPSHGCTYLQYKGKEVNNTHYEVLIRIPKTKY